MQVNVEWVDARERLPEPGEPVAAATYGIWPQDFHDRDAAGEDYWLVRPMVFHEVYIPMTFTESEDDSEYYNCFVDSDGIVRYPPGRPRQEHVTHWAALPSLPGTSVHEAAGDEARSAFQRVGDHRSP
ncbi:AQJ64_40280 family protein [Streptomyces sp. NPDC056486]|uniref:AQJ64_40280 family protein n=1 Tax=Streptomyces sp. NPDC056486 TaxID=3345835 RepID=UPI0036809C55